MELLNAFPLWLQEEHERNGGYTYSVSCQSAYGLLTGVLTLNGNRVDYRLYTDLDGKHCDHKTFRTPKAAANFYLKAARAMKACDKRNIVPTWSQFF